MRLTLSAAGRALGTAAAIGALALWAMFLVRNPYAPPAEGRLITFGGLMMLSALISAAAAALGAHLAMYLLFFASFFPVGLYVLLGEGLFRAIGWLNLVYLAGAMIVHRAVAADKKRGSGGA